MADPFDPGFGGAPVATAGAETGFWENAEAVWDQVFRVDSMTALQVETQKRWEASIAAYQARTGIAVDAGTDISTVTGLIQGSLGQTTSGLDYTSFKSPFVTNNPLDILRAEDRVEKARQVSAEIAALNDPGIQSIEQIIQEVTEMRQEVNLRAQSVGERADWLGTIGGFAGGVTGSFTTRDPLNIASSLAGGTGTTIAKRIGTEMLAGAASESVVQELSIQPTQELLGEQQNNAAEQVLFAGLASGVFGLAGEGLGRLAQRALNRGQAPAQDLRLEFEDAALRSMFEANMDDPRARAGLSSLDDQRLFDAANPYGKTVEGERRFTGEIADIYDMLEGRTSTAVARFIPEQTYTLENLDYLTQRVREDQPPVYERWAQANEALDALDQQIAEISAKADGLNIMDAIGAVNEGRAVEIAQWQARANDPNATPKQRTFAVRKIEELQKNVWAPDPQVLARVEELEAKLAVPGVANSKITRGWAKELDQLLKKLDERPLEAAFDAIDQGLRSELAALRKQRVAVDREFRRSRSVMDREMNRISAEQKLLALVPTQGGPTVPGPRKINPQALRYDNVLAQADLATRTDADMPDLIEAMVRNAVDEDGMITLGSSRIDPNFRFPDFEGNDVTAAQVMKQIEDDRLMVDAMKACAI